MSARQHLAGAIAALLALTAPAAASPPPHYLPDQTILGLKITGLMIFPFHSGVRCRISDPSHVGGIVKLTLGYWDPAGATAPFATVANSSLLVPVVGSVACNLPDLPGAFHHIDHITLTVTKGSVSSSKTVHIGW